MRIIESIKLDFSDVLILPKRSKISSRSMVDLLRTFTFRNSKVTWTGIPICAANMDTTGTFEMANSLAEFKMLTCIHKHYSLEEWEAFLMDKDVNSLNYICVSSGINENDLEKLDSILKLNSNIKFITLDVANGYTQKFVETVKLVREKYPNKVIIAGNVVTAEMTEELILAGADVVKVGIGSGSVCLTRIKAGVGCPQLSAVIECADAAHGLNGLIISDGGCSSSGDVSKAFGAGADFTMMGGFFAGHKESGGELIELRSDGEIIKYKVFYGMSSRTAMEKHYGKMANYRSSEGKKVSIKYKGDVKNSVEDLLGGIRSTCTYVGASKLKELSKRTTFIRVNNQSNEIFGKN